MSEAIKLAPEIRMSIQCVECGFSAEAAADVRSIGKAAEDFAEDGWRIVNNCAACPACAVE